MRVISSIVIASLLLSCSAHKEPQLIKLTYQLIPGLGQGLPSDKYEITENIKTPDGLYSFVADKKSEKSFVLVDLPFESLDLKFSNGKRIFLDSSSHLIGSDDRADKKLELMFNELIRMNITEQQLAMIQSTVKRFCIDTAPKLINKEEIIKINDTDGQTLIGYTVFMNIPEKYQKKKIVGRVTIEVMVNKSGRLVNSRVIKNTGSEILEPAAIELLEKLFFEPATIDCEIADFEGFIVFNFILDDSFKMKN
jgi:TonB family protein